MGKFWVEKAVDGDMDGDVGHLEIAGNLKRFQNGNDEKAQPFVQSQVICQAEG